MTTELREGEGEGRKTGYTGEVKKYCVCAQMCIPCISFTIIYVIASFGSSNIGCNTVL